MEPWGKDQKATEEAVKPLPPGEVPFLEGSRSGQTKRRKTRVVAGVVGALALIAIGAIHNWTKGSGQNAAGNTQLVEKGTLGKFADRFLKSTSLLGGFRGDKAKGLQANKTTKMSGAPLSLPLFFEANRGQTDPQVKFLARSSGYSLFVTPTETVFASAHTSAPRGGLSANKDRTAKPSERTAVRMKLLASNPSPEISGFKELPGKVNYLIGNNPRDWHTGVPLYEEVRSREVYAGIDQVFHGDQQRLEYDFQVAPGADPGKIRFKIAGADKVAVDENGDLVLRTEKNEFRMRKPVIYQPEGEGRRLVEGGFTLEAGKLVAFRVGAYDKKKTLVIDPTIIYATFLGAAGTENPSGIDLDVTNPGAPKLLVAGTTTDITTFSETNTLLGTSTTGTDYAFVAKIDTTTTGAASLNFLTFIGGSLIFSGGTGACQNFAMDLKVDASGGAGQAEPVLLGATNCRDFPVTFGGPTTGTDDIFITRLTPNGMGLDNSTLFGGNGSQGLTSGTGASLFVNQEGTVVVTGSATSTNLATTTNAYSVSFNNGTPGLFDDCYTAKFDRSFNIIYLTYLNVGGNTASTKAAGCGVGSIDAAGKIYLGGNIYSATAFNLINGGAGANGFQTTFVGTPGTTVNGFVAVLDPSLAGLNQMTFASYIAGGGGTAIQAGAVDLTHGLVAITGETLANSTTNAPNIPLLNAFQTTNNAPAGAVTGFVTVMDATKTGSASLVASSYLGGSTGSTSPRAVAFDPVAGNPPTQRIVVGGQTTATDYPTKNPLQASLVGTQNAFVTLFSVPASGNTYNIAPLFSTYLGGGVSISGQSESVRGLIADANHQIYVLGRTASANFFGNTTPATTVNGFQTTCASCGGGTPSDDLAIFVLTPQSSTSVPDLTVSKTHSGSFAQGQSGAQYSITVTNSGNATTVGTVSVVDTLPSSLTATAMTGSGWNCSLATLVCTRADGLGAGMFYPVITLTVTVASNAPPSVTNVVTVSGGSETNTANNTASDVTTITSSVGACTNNYTGLTGGSWGTATNWSTGAVPISTDVVCIPSGITVLENASLAAANQTISALNNSGTLTFSVGPLTVTNNSVANVINMNGGTLAFNGQITVSGPFTQTSGTFAGTGEVDLNGTFTWSGGTICSALTSTSCITGTVAKLNANGGITFPTGAGVALNSRMLNNNGTATWSGTNGSLTEVNSAVINNGVGSVWNYTNDSTLIFGGGGASAFNNTGTFEKTNGSATTTVSVVFNNTGTVLENTGTITFTGGGNCGSSCTGTYTSGSGGILAFNGGVFAQSGPMNGAGTLNFGGGVMDFGTGVETISTTNVNINAGILAGAAPGVIDFVTRPNWSGGTICSSLNGASCLVGLNGVLNAEAGINFPGSANVVFSNRTLNNNGTVTWSGATGSMDMVNAAILNNLAGSVWNYTNDSTLVFGGGTAPVFNNSGTYEKTGGTGTTTTSVNFNNMSGGTVLGNSGTMSFTGGGNCGSTCPGTFTPGTGGTINFQAGIFGQSGPMNGTGTLNFNGATMNFGTGTATISTTNVNLSAGILGGASPGILNFSTPLNWSGGTMCSSLTGASCLVGTNAVTNANAGINFPASANVVLNNRTLNNNGTVTWSGAVGSLDLVNASIINNPVSSVWNYANDSVLLFGGGSAPAFNNGGTFEKTGGTGTTTITLSFNNSGTVLGNSGTLSFGGGGNCGSSCAGTYTAGTGAAISFGGNLFAQSGPINGTGTVNFNGATMDFGTGTTTISTSTVNFTNGTIGGAAPGTLNFSTAINWTGGTMCSSLSSGGACVTGTNATTNFNAGINFLSSANVVLSFRTANNNGPATWSGTAGAMDMVNGAIVNNGATAVWDYMNDSGLSYGGGAAVAFNNSGNFEKTNGTGTTNVSTPFNNTGTVNGNSGTLQFSAGGNCGSVCSGSFAAGSSGALTFVGGTYPVSGPFSGAGTMNFTGATLNLTGTYGVTGPTNVSGGTLNFNEASPVTIAGPLNMTGGTVGGSTPTLNVPGLWTWTAGTLSLPGTTNATGGIALPNAGVVVMNGGTLNTPAAVTFAAGGSGASFFEQNGAIVNNTGTWNLQGDDFVTYNGGTATVFNNNAGGIFEKTGGTGTSQVTTAFNNNGTVTVGNTTGAATLLFTIGGCAVATPCTGNGSWAALAGYTLAFQGGNYNLGGPFSGAGTMNFSGATMTLTGAYSATGPTNVSGGTVNFNEATPVTIAGPLNFSGGTIQGSTPTLNVTGSFNWTAGNLSLPGTTNANGGIAFPNAGAMVLNNGTLNTPAAVTFASGGSGSSFLMSSGAVVNNTGTWNLQGDDFLTYNGGTATVFNNKAGGIFEKTGGTTVSQISTAFNNNGAVTVGAGAGAFTLNFDGSPCTTGSPCTGTGTWTPAAGFTVQFSAGTYNLSGSLQGAGNYLFSGSTMNLTGPYTTTGTTTVSGGTVNFNEASPVTIAGPLTLGSGTIQGTVSILNVGGPFTWNGGNLALPQTTNATGGILFPNAGSMLLSAGTLNTSGAVTFAAGAPGSTFLLQTGAIVNNTGTWNLQGDDFVTFGGGAATTFNNNAGGIFEKTGGTTTSQVTTAFNNGGSVLANSGNLFFSSPYTQSAGATTLGGGSIQTTSTNPMTLHGGSLTGAGTVQGDVTNTGGSVAPGSSTVAGNLSVSGSGLGIYSQSGTGAFNVKIGGMSAGQFDTLTISGAATLSGPLNVSLINAFSPALGNTFTILTAASVTGTFTTTNLPALSAGLGWHVTYSATTVVLSVVTVASPVANLNPGSVSFPNTIVGSPAAVQKVQLQNTGTSALTIASIMPTGTDAGNYFYTPDAVQPCPMSPATLANGASCLLDIGFLPLTAGTHNNAGITVTDDSGNVVGSMQTVTLSGTGIVLNSIAVTPASPTIPQGSTQQFTATGTYSDSSTQNLTSTVTWASATTTVATINAAGLATGVAPGSSNITAKQGSVTSPAAALTVTGATHFAVSSPGTAIAGTSFGFTIFAEDQFNNVVPGYTGTVHFTSSDPLAVLPANATLTNGTGNFQATLKTVGSQTYTATDTVTSSITGTSNAVTVATGGVTHFQVLLSGSAVAGSTDSVQVTALDGFGNAVPGYSGTVHFTSTDPLAVLPANTTLTGGTGTFSVTFKTVGSQSVTATDTVTSTITGTSNAITVVSGAATHFVVAMPGVATVGVATSVTVTALDQFNNLVPSYTGTVHFTSSDASAVLPANTTLTSGTGTFPVTFKTAGSQTATATDTVTSTITGTSNAVLVSTGTTTHLLLTTLPSVTAGTSFMLAVEALDQFNNIVTTYSGTVHFTSTDAAAVLPANSTLTNGVGAFSATLKTTGSQTITGTDTVTSTITGTTSAITVSSTTATHFIVTVPPSTPAGTAVSVSVTALDQFNNLVTGYTGTVHFTSTDAAATLPVNSTLTGGVGVFQATLKTAGSQTVTATDTVTSSITGTSNTIVVGPITATHLLISAPSSATAGAPFNIIVTALDQFNNIATGYTGTVHFTSTDAAATLPSNVTLVNGTNTLSVTLKTLGNQTVTGTDTVTSTITGTSNTVSVSSGVATHFAVSAPGTATAGTAITVTVTALDSFNNIATGYTGTVHFTSNDAAATLPANSTLASGTGSFSVTLKTLGLRTVTATDTVTSTITGTTGTITVSSAAATHFLVTAPAGATAGTAFTVNVTALDQFNNTANSYSGTVHFTSTDAQAVLPANSTLASGIGAFQVTLKTAGSQTITATDTVTTSITGSTNVTVTAVAPTLVSIAVTPLSPVIGSGQVQQFAATGTFSSGPAQDITTAVTWASSIPGVATISNTIGSQGSATAVANGTTLINASMSGVTGTAALTVAPPVGFALTGNLITKRSLATATLLNDGTVLVLGGAGGTGFTTLGSAEIYNPAAGTFTATGNMTTVRFQSTATLLPNGMVLVAGGSGPGSTFLNSAELYNPATGTFTATGSMTMARVGHSATLLPNGTILIVGGAVAAKTLTNTAEVYNPATGTFTATGSMTFPGAGTATLLNNGKVLVVGANGAVLSANLYDPATGTFTPTTGASNVSNGATATLLDSGMVLFTGGLAGGNATANTELYNPTTDTFTTSGSLITGRFNHTATLLNNGMVLVAAGYVGNNINILIAVPSAELYDPIAGTFTETGSLNSARDDHTATLLKNGKVLVAGGDNADSSLTVASGDALASAELYTPATFTQPGLISIAVSPATPSFAMGGFQRFTATGTFSSGGPQTLASVTWSSSNTGDVSITNDVTDSGRAFGLAPGSVTITACEGAVCGSTGATVPATLVSITVAPTSASVAAGLTQGFTATGHFSDGTTGAVSVNWLSSNTGIATINTSGVATGVAAGGPVTITATSTANSAISGTAQLTVTPAVLQTITVAPTSTSVVAGLTVPFTATGHFSNGTTGAVSVNWLSSNTGIATISASGVATGVAAGGPVTITATSTANAAISGTAQLTVTVAGPTLQTITVTPANPTIATNGIQTFIAIGHFSDGTSQNLTSAVTWGSMTTAVATINTAGVATGVSAGTSTISATQGAVIGSTALTVTGTTAHAYVGDVVSANCCLDVIDTTTNTIVKQIPITNVNEPLGITPDQTRVYVPDNVGSVLDVIDTTTNTLVNTIPVGNGTTAVVITPNGKFGYVSGLNDGNVSVFNVSTNAVVATIPIGFSAGWLSVTPDGAFVYASGGFDGHVAVINTATNTVSTTFLLTAPAGQPAVGCVTGPTFNPEGTLGYFSLFCSAGTPNGNTIDVLSIPSNALVATIPVGTGPFQTAISPDGSRLYSANAVANNVSVINTATNAVIASVPMPGHAESIALTQDGAHAYIADTNARTVSVLQTSTNTVTASIATTVPFGIVIASPPAATAATTLTLTPPNLVFGAQVDGTQSVSQTINVKNPGATPVMLTSILLSGPNIGDFRLVNGCPAPPATLGAGASCNLQVSSDPTTNGQRIALVTINSTNGTAASTQSAPLSATGISLVSIAVTPANPTVVATNTVQFTATGTFSDNSTQNLTGSVIWTSSSTGIATINASGLATGVAAGGPITITATSGNIFGSTQLTVTPLITFPLNVTLIGTGTGKVTDNLGSINCVNTAGVTSGTCSANYPSGTIVMLTATPTAPSTFGGFLGACTGTGACSVTMTSAQAVTASFVPAPQSVPISFTPGTNVSAQAVYDCPSNPNPTPANPCLDPNANAAAFTIGQVLSPFTLTVVSTEVPPLTGNGICENGLTAAQDLDCRFKTFFTYQTNPNGDTIVPLCVPFANGNCVVFSVFFQNPGQEPDPSMYVGPVNWNITYNNGTFVPPAPWAGSQPRLYYDPSGFVVPNSPYGTDCTTPMLIGNPGVPTNPAIFCQFVFDITTIFDATKKVDPLIGGKTKVFSDAIVAFPPNFAPVVTVTTTPDAATVTAGSPIGFTITVSDSPAAAANNVSLNTPLPGGTNVSWTISPAYAGPGTCSITGPQGSQVLNCAIGTLSVGASATLHIQSPSSAAGTAISPSTVNVGPQQLFSIGSIVVQPIPVTFSGLTASQTITGGTTSVTLAGVVGNGTQFAPSGESVSITINGNKQTATIGSNGAFTLQFPTAAIPISVTPYPITYSYAGDSLLSAASNSATTLTVTPLGTFPLNVTLIGTGTGSVKDNLGSINCVNTAGVTSGTCSASYPSGTVVVLTATATQPSTFGGWLQACSGTGGCSVTMNSTQAVTASFVPPPQMAPLPFTPGTNVMAQAPFDCPSNPNPTPANPCLDPNANAAAFTIGQVLTPFTLTVMATEVPPTNGDGICENGRTPAQDLDCRFGTFFTFQTKANGDRVVPLCVPFANGNCVVYSVFFQNPGQEPDPSMYVGPVNWNITYNNSTFVPPAPWAGSQPRLYYDPSGFVVPNSPYGTDCTTPMLIGNPGVPTNPAIFCQFVFDITTVFDATKKVDPLIGGKTKVFSDAIVAFPPVFAPVVTVTTTPDAATVTAGSPIGFTITVSNSPLAVANNVSLNTPLPGGTNVNWTISPAYAGPGTCSITGPQGSQVLNCAIGTLSAGASASLHIQSPSSAAGTAISPSTVNVGPQQLLSIGSIVVQPIPVTFSGLTASQTIPVGTSSVTLGGVIGNGTQFAPSGEMVSITINGTKVSATVGSNGTFSTAFPTATIPGSTTSYPISYSYAGDSLLSPATNASTTLTVVSPPAGVNLSASVQSATVDASGNYVFTIRVTNSGGTAATAAAIKTAALTTVVGTTRVTTASTTTLPVNLGSIASLSSVTTTLTFPGSAGPPNTAGAISLGLGFTGGSASAALKATLP